MDQFFTITMSEQPSKETHKLLQEKLNSGFYVDNHITTGRSTLLVMRKREERSNRLTQNYATEMAEVVASISI